MPRALVLLPLLLLGALGIACSGASDPLSTAEGDAGDAGCIQPVLGAPCTAADEACEPDDPCLSGFEWKCDAHSLTWAAPDILCRDAGVDAEPPPDAGCITPTEGEACTSREQACQPPDPCCAGYEWVCTPDGVWQEAGLGCACQAPGLTGVDSAP